ncbi:MAG: Hsp33 family molecular chaperone [Bradyrhizobiaceae bacterium]|nr:Hsp33 family molecular chaperone [Bradyrhizobiaceae bacterium]
MNVQIPERRPRDQAEDDQVQAFQVEALDVRGRIARLGPMLDEMLGNHDYPQPVARALAEATTLAVLLGSTHKQVRRFILQTQTDGAVDLMVVDITAPDRVRAYARFDSGKLEALSAPGTGALVGNGHLAMTIEAGGDHNRYQGIVALQGEPLEAAAHRYFMQSEQIPTRLKLAVGEKMHPGGAKATWRAGAMLVQFLPEDSARAAQADFDPGDAPEGHELHTVEEDDAWTEAQSLIETVEDHELLDPTLSSERLLWRLFNERGVRVFNAQTMTAQCTCSRERVMSVLKSFPQEERADMVEDGQVQVTCEFCGRHYAFAPEEIGVEDASGEAGE